MREFGWFAVIAGAVMLEALTAPGTGLSGNGWRLRRSSQPGTVRLTLERSRPGSRSITTNDVPLTGFRGFTLDMLDRSGPAKFSYVQDAATFECEGKFAWGQGSGSFTITPNPQFTADLKNLGFASPDRDELFLLAISATSLDFIREAHSAGIVSSLRDVLDLAAHGVNSQYIHEVARIGYRNLKAQDYIAMRDHGVEPRFLQALKDAGYQPETGQVIELRDHGVDSDYMRALGAHGLHPDPSELVALRDHGVTPDYLRDLRDGGYDTVGTDEIIALRDHGVGREFILTAHDLGYRFTSGELVELHDHGVDGHYLRTIRDSGMRNLTADQIVRLHDHGVE